MHAPLLFKASVLAITFALSAIPVWAQQQAGVKGDCQGADTIADVVFDPLATVTVNIPNTGTDDLWYCAFTCSIQTDRPKSKTAAHGELALTINGNKSPNTERDFEHTSNATANDLSFQEVSTTKYESFVNGNAYTLACAARKLDAADPNFDVRRSCITVVCTDESL